MLWASQSVHICAPLKRYKPGLIAGVTQMETGNVAYDVMIKS